MMQNKINLLKPLFLLLFTLTWLACGSKSSAPISAEKMKDVLFDLQVAEAYSANVDTGADKGKKNQDTLSHYYALAFQKHGIGLEDWEAAMDWYLKHPAVFDSIFKQIIDTANTFKIADKDASESDSLSAQQQQPEEDKTIEAATTAPSVQGDRPKRPTVFEKAMIKQDLVDPDSKEELDAIKKKSKEKREALEKVKNEK